ncbi:serine/threonine protein kinase [Zavarzinella formosa]|uniref:serine/threonine protein kinase n=1 Tax=Zavarzinella formosa TaxID=360055 RepID=UPI0002E80CFE|nr:serine/threonine-protein kinase [Zavarzinella formosa]
MHRSNLRHLNVGSHSPSALGHHANYEWSSLRPLLPEAYISELQGLRDEKEMVGALIDNELAWRASMARPIEPCDIWRRLDDLNLSYAECPRKADTALVLERYRQVRLLGEGGCGSVWLMQDENTGLDVALKRLHASAVAAGEDDEATTVLDTLAREWQALRQLAGLRVAQLLDYAWVPMNEASLRVPILVQAFVPGPTLADFIAVEGRLYAATDCLRVIIEVAEILRLVHNRHRIHRDIKPSNIGFDSHGLPILIDFGISSGLAQDSKVSTTTSLGATPAYAPPEWIKGNGSRNVSGEVYCLASTLYHLLTRRLPYPNAPTLVDQYLMKINGPPDRPSSVRDGLPIELDQILMRALSPSPDDRYQSIVEFADELQAVKAKIDSQFEFSVPNEIELIAPLVAGEITNTIKDDVTGPKQSRLNRHKVLFLGVLAVALALLGGFCLSLNPARPPIGPDEVTVAISNYAATQEPARAASLRFLRLDHRHNDPEVRSEDLTELRQAIRELLAHLAGQPIEVIELPHSQSTVLVLDLRQLGWQPGHWDLLMDHYPYGVYQGNLPADAPLNVAARQLHQLSGAKIPFVRADWFLAAVTSPPLESLFAKLSRLHSAANWPPITLRARESYFAQTLTLNQMAREVGVDSWRLRKAIEAGDVGEKSIFQPALDGGALSRRVWEGTKEDLMPPFFTAIEVCGTGEAIRPPP